LPCLDLSVKYGIIALRNWVLSRSHEFKGHGLARAIAATFARRKTAIPKERPDALTRVFAEDPMKQRQWASFVRDVAVKPDSLVEVVDGLADFLMPRAAEARTLSGDAI
jgi:hypothetical protein